MLIIPDHWGSVQNCGDLLQGRDRDVPGDDLVARPHDVNIWCQL